MNLWLISAPAKRGRMPNMTLLRTIADVQRGLGHPNPTYMSAQRALAGLLTASQPLGESQDSQLLSDAQEALKQVGCTTWIGHGDPPGTHVKTETPAEPLDAEASEEYSAAQIALIVLAHTGGNPQLAASATKMQERVLRDVEELEAADYYADAFDLLVDTFKTDEQESIS